MIRVLNVVSSTGVYQHRLGWISQYIDKHYPEIQVDCTCYVTPNMVPQMTGYDIVAFNRRIALDYRGVFENLIAHGIKTVCDVDDYWELPTNHILYDNYKAHGITQQLVEMIQASDHVTTTNDYLKSKLEEVVFPGTPITIIPNCINPEIAQFQPHPTLSPFIRVGFVGGSTHEADINLLRGVRLPQGFQLHLFGYSNTDTWRRIEQSVLSMCNVTPGYKEWLAAHPDAVTPKEYTREGYIRQPALSIDRYANIFNLIDIVFAPLEDSEFCRCKSELKGIEAGHFSKMLMCSDISTYKMFEGKCFMSNDVAEWNKMLNKIQENPKIIIDYRNKLHAYVLKHYDIADIAQRRVEVYHSLVR